MPALYLKGELLGFALPTREKENPEVAFKFSYAIGQPALVAASVGCIPVMRVSL